MRRTLALFLTAAVAGGLGGVLVVAIGGDDDAAVSPAPARAAAPATGNAGLSHRPLLCAA